MEKTEALDALIKSCSEGDNGKPMTEQELYEAAQCARHNIKTLRPVAEANLVAGIGYAQAVGICNAVIAAYESEEEPSASELRNEYLRKP